MKEKTMDITEDKKILFAWRGVNATGMRVRGESSADSELQLKSELFRQGIKVKKMQKKVSIFSGDKKRKIKPSEITVFCRQLSVMLQAGIPIVETLDSIGKDHENASMRELILSLKDDIAEGSALSDALKKQPKYFDTLCSNLVHIGEQTGSLVKVLDNIATYKEKSEALRKKVKKALFYPVSIVVLSLMMSMVLLLFVVPQFEAMFKGFGAELPAFTRMILVMSEAVQHYWYFLFLFVGLTIFAYKKARQNIPEFLYFTDDKALKFPVIGRIIRFSVISRVTRTMAIAYSAGVPLVEVLKSLADVADNSVFRCAILQIHDGVELGEPLNKCMQLVSLFPAPAIQMVSVGENTGALDTMLLKVADYYEAEVDNLVDVLSSLIEPLVMLVLGVIVGGFVIGMYLPIFQLGSVI